jgi:hypothetical protein
MCTNSTLGLTTKLIYVTCFVIVMKKSVFIVILVVSLLLIACKPRVPAGENPQDTSAALRQVRTGTQGVEISLLANYPPRTIYDENELVAIVEVRNKGNKDLGQSDCFIHITGFDPNIISGPFGGPLSCANPNPELEGKNIYNLEGGFNQLEFESSNIILPEDVAEYKPTLNFLACYSYQTKANPSVCVDPLRFQVTSEQKACDYRRGVVTDGSQGAPVRVSNVRADMVTSRSRSRAVFEIDIDNAGGGQILSPDTDIQNCATAVIGFTDTDRLRYDVRMTGGSLVSCSPGDGIVRMNNGRGKVVCTFDISEGSAFETPLIVTLDYNYMKSFRQPVHIIQTPE